MSIEYLEREKKPPLAYKKLEAEKGAEICPTLVFCGGFRSDMEGTKAQYLEEQCRLRGQGYIRFDYSGHGASGGDFEKGTIGVWKQDTLDILDTLTQGSIIIAGSSMGGWIALLCALDRPERIKGMIGIAAAPDFTRDIYHNSFTPALRAQMENQGFIEVPSEYSETPYRISKALIEDGERHCLLDSRINLDIPVRLLQGMKDTDVPWQKAYRIKNAMENPSLAEVFLIENGDHRLSRPEDLALLNIQIKALLP